MELKQLVSLMTPDNRAKLSLAVEIGRWADGTKLTEEQLSSTMQVLIAWEAYHGEVTDEPFKVQLGGELNKTAVKDTSIKHQNKINDSETSKASMLDVSIINSTFLD